VTRRVQLLRLSGLDADEAARAVRDLLADRSVPDLRSLLVLDDTATLLEHASAFEDLLTSGRLRYLLCVAIGPAADRSQPIVVPGGISSGQGSAVVWVSDPLGVDWPLSASAVAIIRPDSTRSGLDHLVEALSEVDVLDRVRELVIALPSGVASPGLRLAGASEEAVNFPAALAAAIRRFTVASTTSQLDPLIPAQDAHPGQVGLTERGELDVSRERCIEAADVAVRALDELAGLRGLLSARQQTASVRTQIVATGTELQAFRQKVQKLLENAHAPGGLTERQRQRLREAGLQLAGNTPAGNTPAGRRDSQPDWPDPDAVAEPGIVGKAVAQCVRAGDPLPQVAGRLALSERQLSPQGSRAYLPEVEQRCPESLVQQLMEPLPLPGPQPWLPVAGTFTAALGSPAGQPGIVTGLAIVLAWTGILALTVSEQAGGIGGAARRTLAANLLAGLLGAAVGVGIGLSLKPSGPVAGVGLVLAIVIVLIVAARSWRARATAWQHLLSPGRAASAAGALADLVTRVASTDWSADSALLDAIVRTKIGIQGVNDQLREYADGVDKSRAGQPYEPPLTDGLSPTLRQLALAVLAAQPARNQADGQVGYRQARATTGELIAAWVATAAERGPLAWPPFAASDGQDTVATADQELGEITAVTTYDPYEVMWQLCAPGELTMLDTGGRPGIVAFAPRAAQRQLNRVLPTDTVWTSSSVRAGLLRLVPLRAGGVQLIWSTDVQGETFE
jgi:hypothetical protein